MPEPVLRTVGLRAFYGDFQALFGIDFEVYEGETVAVIGSNGAGKTTFLRAVTGMVATHGQDITYLNANAGGVPPHVLVRRGLAMVPEGRKLFPSLTVEENLLIGGYGRSGGEWSLEKVYKLFQGKAASRRH